MYNRPRKRDENTMGMLPSRGTLLNVVFSAVLVCDLEGQSLAADKIKLRMAGSGSATGTRVVVLEEKFESAISKKIEYISQLMHYRVKYMF